ncbi:MAG: hypothetical protein QM784_27935 [Polyangiaceae bacterium]
MADRTYTIDLKITGDASGASPVTSGLQQVDQQVQRTTDDLKKLEDQARQTDRALSSSPAGGGSQVDGGSPLGIPRPHLAHGGAGGGDRGA